MCNSQDIQFKQTIQNKQDKQSGLLIVISGPSGVGKDTVLKKLFELENNLQLSVSYTTRNPRVGEVHGKDYYFVSEKEFFDVVNCGNMLEYANYCGNYYGTPLNKLKENLDLGNNIILEIEVQGGEQIFRKFPEAVGIFIIPPSIQELSNRLKNRGLDSEEVISKRINQARREIEFANFYKYVIINNNINECAGKIVQIINSESCVCSRMKPKIMEVLNSD